MKFLLYMTTHWAILGIVPSIVGIIRYRELDKRLFPFLLFVWLGFANDSLSYFTGKYLRTNAPNQDIYFLIEYALVVWMFWRWHLFRDERTPKFLLAVSTALWIWETLIYRSLNEFNSITHSTFAFIALLLTVQYINKLIVTEQKLGLSNSDFLICSSFVFYFSAATITELFWLFGFNPTSVLANRVYEIMSYTNAAANLIFAIALLCAPKKQRFLQLS